MDFTKINKIAAGLPTKKVSELNETYSYRVTLLKKVDTRFGERAVAELGDDEVQIYLPLRVSNVLINDEEMFRSMNESIINRKLFIRYSNKSIQFNSS